MLKMSAIHSEKLAMQENQLQEHQLQEHQLKES